MVLQNEVVGHVAARDRVRVAREQRLPLPLRGARGRRAPRARPAPEAVRLHPALPTGRCAHALGNTAHRHQYDWTTRHQLKPYSNIMGLYF
jgi:hypothetical protein